MQNATAIQSDGEAAAMIGAAAAPESGAASEAAVAMPPEPEAMRETEAVDEAEPQLAPVIEAAAEEAPQQETEAFTPANGSKSPKSPAPLSPSKVKERQISVDPASLRRLGMVADEDSPLSAPSVFTEVVVQSPLLPPLRRPTFVGASLPCSAASSPVHGAGPGASAKWEESPTMPSPRSALSSLARQHSAALARLVVAAPPPAALSRSASRAEGRTMAPHDDDDEEEHDNKALTAAEEGPFTCGALCMLIPIPGFSKPKKPAAVSTGVRRQQSSGGGKPRRSSASRVASLERFECGSWSPPPLEVPKVSCAGDDTESPVKMAFIFDGGEAAAPTPRGILKNSASASRLSSARPSTSSQRHVRFSTAGAADVAAVASCPSSPTSVVTPRLARARAEFNAFLEAQSA